jgi:hypothetical protein
MSLYLQHGWCYVFVPSDWEVLCLCTFSLGGVMSFYLQFGRCYVFVPSVWEITPPKLKVQRHNTSQTEGTKT